MRVAALNEYLQRYAPTRTTGGGSETLHAHRRTILELATHHGARNVRVFGSMVRGDARPNSDIDLLIEIVPGRTLLDLIAFEQDLEESSAVRLTC